jgi:hypothetical protein
MQSSWLKQVASHERQTSFEVCRSRHHRSDRFDSGGFYHFLGIIMTNDIETMPTKRGIRVTCSTCRRTKQPIGRSAPLGFDYCDWECPGYRLAPFVGSLWPGETDVDFGFSCSDQGTEPIL